METKVIKIIDDGFTSINEATIAATSVTNARVGQKTICDASDNKTTVYFIYEIR